MYTANGSIGIGMIDDKCSVSRMGLTFTKYIPELGTY